MCETSLESKSAHRSKTKQNKNCKPKQYFIKELCRKKMTYIYIKYRFYLTYRKLRDKIKIQHLECTEWNTDALVYNEPGELFARVWTSMTKRVACTCLQSTAVFCFSSPA